MKNVPRIAAVTMVKNEDDLIYHTLIHLAEEGVDVIIVADNMSTDKTLEEIKKAKEVLKGSPCHIEIVKDEEVGYYQSQKMTALAHRAKKDFWCDWIIPFDADELHYSHEGKISDVLHDLDDNVGLVEAKLFNHFPSAVDPAGLIPFETIQWRQKEAGALPKVAVKWHKDLIIHQGNHSAVAIAGSSVARNLELRHFPYRTWEQFKRKAINGAKAYQATNLKNFGDHWLSYNALIEKWGDAVVEKEVFRTYFWFFSPIDNDMILDPAPFRRWNKKADKKLSFTEAMAVVMCNGHVRRPRMSQYYYIRIEAGKIAKSTNEGYATGFYEPLDEDRTANDWEII